MLRSYIFIHKEEFEIRIAIDTDKGILLFLIPDYPTGKRVESCFKESGGEIMALKGTRVTQQEKEKTWQLYQDGNSFAKIKKKLHCCPTPFPAMCMNMKPL